MPVCDKHLHVELNSDFSLPDYKSEIRRLLWTRACVIPPSEYVGNGSATLSGEIQYKILYLGADGGLYSATLSDSYSIDAPFEFNAHSVNTDDVCVFAFCLTDSVNTRVLGPRRLNIRSRVSCRALALSPAIYTPELIGVHNAASIENLIFESPALSALKCVGDPISVTDHITLEAGFDNARIIDTTASAFVSECSTVQDKINIKGDVLLKILYCNDAESEHPLMINKRLPFSATVYCEGVSASFECAAHCFISDESFTVEENGIDVEFALTPCAIAQKVINVPYIADAYSTERATVTSTAEMSVMHPAKCFNGNLTQNDVFSLDEAKISHDAKIVDVCGKVTPTLLSLENGRLVLTGSCDYQVVYYLDGEYSVRPLSAPLRYEIDCKGAAEPSELYYGTQVSIAAERARSDGERLYIDSELCVCCFAQASTQISYLKDMSFGDRHAKTSGELVLCFPERDADVWSVAKLYGESQRKIRLQNSIAEGETCIKKKFIVI